MSAPQSLFPFRDMTPIQRHRQTCPLCQKICIHGSALDRHLADDHALGADERFSIYQQQVKEWPS